MAILYGYWKTFKILVASGAAPSLNGRFIAKNLHLKKVFKHRRSLAKTQVINNRA